MTNKKMRHQVIPNSAKLPKIKTINDLLARDDINGILADLNKRKPDITDMIVIFYNKRKDTWGWTITDNTSDPLATYLLESTKLDLLTPVDNED